MQNPTSHIAFERSKPIRCCGRAVGFAARAVAIIVSMAIGGMAMTGVAHAEEAVVPAIDADPYTVYVAHESAFTRCGPDGKLYRTERLRHGQALDVYLETDDGWLGVRPPEDSFSWIQADDVDIEPNGKAATVRQDRSVVWIGTQLGRARQYRWQVQLAEGERVTILGRSEREGPDGPTDWLRIVPPSGEFRWVHRDQVAMSAEELIAQVQQNQMDAPESCCGDDLVVGGAQSLSDSSDSQTIAQVSGGAKSPSYAQAPDLVPLQSQEDSHRRVAAASTEQDDRLTPIQAQPELRSPSAGQESFGTFDAPLADAEMVDRVIGSGVDPNRIDASAGAANMGQRGQPGPSASDESFSDRQVSNSFHTAPRLSTARITSDPRLVDTGSAQAAPSADQIASDANWIGASRSSTTSPIQTVGGIQPLKAQVLGDVVPAAGWQTGRMTDALSKAADGFRGTPTRGRQVDAARIAQIEGEAVTADIARLQLVFARLIADSAASVEVEPILRAAQRIADQSGDHLVARRAAVLVERAEQYIRIADRRDGGSMVTGHVPVGQPLSAAPMTATIRPVGNFQPVSEPSVAPEQVGVSHQTDEVPGADPADVPSDLGAEWVSGKLVQVYSARANHPPFAVQDNTGKTLAYATPSPGYNLRRYLNQEIRVTGNHGYLSGLRTPHVLVTRAVRVMR
ncbi:hypothetical protein [Crateriforma conspicua]|uniref:Uncharacterized protein n=1 Tax=Crateriforma conspicua TaxID=2527996 RepID=A0A5C6G115_9PLAN|nr:hypothetical protein [Crateriforma conspicua]TWU67575.1 hypothetical protein V7x_31490 [Crateriforma conspicua]